MNKEFQLGILRICAKKYPQSVSLFSSPLERDPIARELEEFLAANDDSLLRPSLHILKEFGYLDYRFSSGRLAECCITPTGLVAVGVDTLHPDAPELVYAIRALTEAVRALKE